MRANVRRAEQVEVDVDTSSEEEEDEEAQPFARKRQERGVHRPFPFKKNALTLMQRRMATHAAAMGGE